MVEAISVTAESTADETTSSSTTPKKNIGKTLSEWHYNRW